MESLVGIKLRLAALRCSVYLLYWYKGTNTDATPSLLSGELSLTSTKVLALLVQILTAVRCSQPATRGDVFEFVLSLLALLVQKYEY